MNGATLVRLAAKVYGLSWSKDLAKEIGVDEDEVIHWSKVDNDLPPLVIYAVSRVFEKYMLRVETMQLNTKIADSLLSGISNDDERAGFMAGMLKSMHLMLEFLHGNPDALRDLAKAKDFDKNIEKAMGR